MTPDLTSQPCPAYASAACYTGAASHNVLGNQIDEIYKGCSSFELDSGFLSSNNTINNEAGEPTDYSITKTSCRGANCNNLHIPPSEPGSPPGVSGAVCQVCSVIVDQYNNTVGVGQDQCWGGNPMYNQVRCPRSTNFNASKLSV